VKLFGTGGIFLEKPLFSQLFIKFMALSSDLADVVIIIPRE
jgi:hypothetical protein